MEKEKTLIQPKFARPPPEAVSPLPGTSAKALLHNFSAMGVSTSGGTPKWLVYTGKSNLNDLKWMITRGPYFRKPPHVEVSKKWRYPFLAGWFFDMFGMVLLKSYPHPPCKPYCMYSHIPRIPGPIVIYLVEVSWNREYPLIVHFNWNFPCKPSMCGSPHGYGHSHLWTQRNRGGACAK